MRSPVFANRSWISRRRWWPAGESKTRYVRRNRGFARWRMGRRWAFASFGGTPLTSNAPFARMLGYDSPAELLRIGSVLGVFATTEEQSRVLREQRKGYGSGAFFRHKDGDRICLRVMAAHCPEQDTVALVTYHASTEE